MLDHAEIMFSGRESMMKRLKKASYEKNMASFREQHGHYFDEMTAYVEAAQDQDQAAGEVARTFAQKVDQAFRVRGKVRPRMQADLNFFMIFYVFPAILLTGHPQARRVADAVRDAWRAQFPGNDISYSSYDALHGSFREKIFGIF